MEHRHVSLSPRPLREEPAKAAAGGQDFAKVVARLLDEFDASDFRSAERILDAVRRQGRTIAGYPKIRPKDCDRVIRAMRAAFEANYPLFVTGDRAVVQRFDQVLEAFAETDVWLYPSELMRLRALQAEAKLLLNDPESARKLIGEYADRPYKIEGDLGDLSLVLRLDCQARAASAQIDGLGRLSIQRALVLSRHWPFDVGSIASEFIEFLGLGAGVHARAGLLTWLIHRVAQIVVRPRIVDGSRERRRASASGRLREFQVPLGGSRKRRLARKPAIWFGVGVVAACLFLLRFGDIRFAPKRGKTGGREIVVSRAMGGIGDLFMMTPGLRALSKRYSTKVKFITYRKYFDIFRNNPYVETIDIDGPPIDVTDADLWINLTICPAGSYEAARVPFIKKGRQELFAKAMGVQRRALDRHGWGVEYVLDGDQIAFRETFVRDAGLGNRPIVGVQPYARDSYRNHPDIVRFIEALSGEYDIVVFHHVETDLPYGPGIASTAGLMLWQSIALVSALHAMVCVDSSFLHAAAAFDVPVVAMFGPTDGQLRTRHHYEATVISMNAAFPCAPCWRNEDLPCGLTGQLGPSPCIAAIKTEPVLAAVAAAIQEVREPSAKRPRFSPSKIDLYSAQRRFDSAAT
jgi:ADP-heptose:LPS heptosyltransferase